jgi:RNA polymerase sigma-70 factor (ECF subfamily)
MTSLPVAAEDPRDAMPDHIPSLRAFAISLTRNVSEADDLVQETILKAWSNIDKFTVGTDMRAWLFTILRNTFFSSKRKTRREVSDTDGAHAATMFEKPHHDGRLAFTDFSRAFDKLSPEHREVLVLVGANGYSYEEAAQMMGVAVGTAKSRANRARARLCELLGMAEGEDILAEQSGATLAVMGRSGFQAA